MVAPTVTHTFSNSTTADATQVNTNFSDIISALTDGTKSFSIDAITIGGQLTANSTVILGASSSNDLTINASLASTIAIKTNNTYNIGAATLGLAGIYFGAPSSRSTRITANQSLTASHTLVLPDGNGNSREYLQTDGSGNLSWQAILRESSEAINYAVAASVNANALTVALKAASGSDASSANPANFGFRSATAATGTPTSVAVTGALSMTVSSGSTLGHTSAVAKYIYVYLINNAGTAELAVSSTCYDDGSVVTTTAEGGAGGADSASLIYSTTARTGVPLRLIGRMLSTQATAGTWASSMTEISLLPFKKSMTPTIQRFTSGSGTYTTPAGVVWLRVTCVGGGGGGAGSGTASIGSGSTGGNTTFGTSLLTAGLGNGGSQSGSGGTGGVGTINSPAITVINFTGGRGMPSSLMTGTGFQLAGASGGMNMAGGSGQGTYGGAGAQGENAAGSGGGGGTGLSNAANNWNGSGGGAAAFIVAIIPAGSVSSTYSYAVGSGGNGGTAGTNGTAGGNGGSGVIIVEEFYE